MKATNMSLITQLQNIVYKIQQQKPLVLNLTNYVTQDFIANSLLAIGAAPIMSESIEELPELIKLANGININIGTLNQDFIGKINCIIDCMPFINKPIVLDPVGSGATALRTSISKKLLPLVNVVRGNASEIMSISDSQYKTLGVETMNTTQEARAIALHLVKTHNNIIVVSGETDLIISGNNFTKLSFGTNLMQLVTGMGCALNSIIAAFCAVESDYFQAAKLATLYFNLCGETAAQTSTKPASFKITFIDTLHSPNWEFIKNKLC